MKIRLSFALASIKLLCLTGALLAQPTETMKFTGRVTAVDADSLTVARDTSRTFVVDASTKVTGTGVDTKGGESVKINELVGEKDSVTVVYEDPGGDGKFHAVEIEIHVKHNRKR